MYRLSIKKVFSREELKHSKNSPKSKKTEGEKSTLHKKEMYVDFIRYLKTFVFFSIQLSIKSSI